MRLFELVIFLGISHAQWENYSSYEDMFGDYENEVSAIGSFFENIEFQNICKRTPEDDFLVGALNDVRGLIEVMDEHFTEFLTNKDFQAFTLVDMMKIAEGFLKNMNKNWCNKFLSVYVPAMESGVDELKQTTTGVADSIVGVILNIFRGLGVNPQVDRLVAMLEEVKAFMLTQSDLFGEAKDIVQAIKFTASADPSNLDDFDQQCIFMNEVMPIVDIVKPLALGLIGEFNNAFSGKEALLSIGKMIYFEYRLSKHFLLNEKACTKLTEDGARLIGNLMGEMNGLENFLFQVNVDQLLAGDLSQLMNMATTGRRRREAESSMMMMNDIMSILGDFVKSEKPPAGQQPLTYDIYKMSQIGEAVLKSVPNMVKTVKSNMGPLLEMVGMDKQTIIIVMDGIKEEDFRALADEMSADLSSATEKMVCGDVKNCEDLVSFKSQAETEFNEAVEPIGLYGAADNGAADNGGADKEIISFTTLLLLLFVSA